MKTFRVVIMSLQRKVESPRVLKQYSVQEGKLPFQSKDTQKTEAGIQHFIGISQFFSFLNFANIRTLLKQYLSGTAAFFFFYFTKKTSKPKPNQTKPDTFGHLGECVELGLIPEA